MKTTGDKEKNLLKKRIKIFKGIESDRKENIFTDINKSEIKTNECDNKSKIIKVNKMKLEKINLDIDIDSNSMTNRNFYKKPYQNDKINKLTIEAPNNIKKYISNFYNLKKPKVISIRGFNKTFYNKDLLLNKENSNLQYKQYKQLIKINNCSSDKIYNYRYNYSENAFNICTNKNPFEINKVKNNSSKISFKNIKSFYAHLEIFISLYLKRIFKNFIKKIKNNEKSNIINNIENLHNPKTNINNFGPIFNVNNAHCSLYYSINVNQNKLFNTISDDSNEYYNNNTFNSTINPLTKSIEIGKNRKPLIAINSCNFIGPKHKININSNNDEINNKNIYSKKKISRNNTKLIYEIKTNNIKNLKIPPIKEMNINLKKKNVCRLNDLNQLYLTQNQILYNNKCNNYNFTEINPLVNRNNSNFLNHIKYDSNDLFSLNNNNYYSNNSNISIEKNKLKKIPTNSGIYIKPKDKSKKKKIEEIIINKYSSLKKENNNLKSGNISPTYNSVNRKKKLNVQENLNTINIIKEIKPIKNIYIKRISQDKHSKALNLKENFDFNKKIKNKNNNEMLIKQIITKDKKIYITIKYLNYINNNYNKKEKYYQNLQIKNELCISIINNKIYESNSPNGFNTNIKKQDIFLFDNEKKGNNNKNKLDNISFSFKDYSPSKINRIIKSKTINFINYFKKNHIYLNYLSYQNY